MHFLDLIDISNDKFDINDNILEDHKNQNKKEIISSALNSMLSSVLYSAYLSFAIK